MNSRETEKRFTTESGISLKKAYTPEDVAGLVEAFHGRLHARQESRLLLYPGPLP